MVRRRRGSREKYQIKTSRDDEKQAEEIAGASQRIQHDVKNLYLYLLYSINLYFCIKGFIVVHGLC